MVTSTLGVCKGILSIVNQYLVYTQRFAKSFQIQCDIHEGLQQLQQLKKEYIHTEHDLLTSGSGNRDSSSLDALVALKDKLQQARSDLGVQYEKLFQVWV